MTSQNAIAKQIIKAAKKKKILIYAKVNAGEIQEPPKPDIIGALNIHKGQKKIQDFSTSIFVIGMLNPQYTQNRKPILGIINYLNYHRANSKAQFSPVFYGVDSGIELEKISKYLKYNIDKSLLETETLINAQWVFQKPDRKGEKNSIALDPKDPFLLISYAHILGKISGFIHYNQRHEWGSLENQLNAFIQNCLFRSH